MEEAIGLFNREESEVSEQELRKSWQKIALAPFREQGLFFRFLHVVSLQLIV